MAVRTHARRAARQLTSRRDRSDQPDPGRQPEPGAGRPEPFEQPDNPGPGGRLSIGRCRPVRRSGRAQLDEPLGDRFAHTWDSVVLAALTEGSRRRSLRARIGGISDKALTEALYRLTGNGLIERRFFPEAPPRGDYALTDPGHSFTDGPMRALGAWVTEHGDELFEAQERLTAS
ncbi:helix-turn-helix transcriptional regulator [Micromonospora sp. CPCC 205371]|nr:helix-turn-helix transcriptional regulator [Micromonospora sp. CPCC 205371]